MIYARTRGCPIICPCAIDEICNFESNLRSSKIAAGQDSADKDTGNETVTKFMVSMEAAMSVARRLVESQQCDASTLQQEVAAKRVLNMADFKVDHTIALGAVIRSSVETYRSDFQIAYVEWKQAIEKAEKTPNQQQWQVLDFIHERCLYEYREESKHCINATSGAAQREPLFRLVHGLPGSGKSHLLKWIRCYFEDVWKWESGVHFVFLAPFNSMATEILGQTLHYWGGIVFKKSSGLHVGSGVVRKGKDKIEQIHAKCET